MQALLNTLKTGRSLLIGISVAVSVFALAVWLPNLQLLAIVWENSATSLWDKVTLPLSLLSAITTNFTPLSATYTIFIAILAGINVALIIELVRERRIVVAGATAGGAGIIAGALGVGCAACGSLIVTALAGTTIGTGTLAFLPLVGSEFGLVGVGLLNYSTYLLAQQLTKTTCDITV
jgi:hypothetical protein